MSKIIIDARESGTSTGRYIDKVIEHMHTLRPEHDVVVLTKPHRLDYIRGIAPNFEVIESPFKEFTFAEQLGFKKQLNSLNADLVHFAMVQQPVLYRGKVMTTMHDLITVRFRNPAKNPLIFTIKQKVYAWVNKKVAHKSRAIITPTQFVKDDVAAYAGIDPNKITVTYEAADKIPDEPEPIAGLENSQFIMYVGRPTPHKNLGRLIKAFVELKKQHPSLKLVLAGKKDVLYEAHEAEAQKLGVADIVFTGFVSEGQLRWLYENCTAYAFPSLSEGFGLPGLEAMIHGALVASSNATCLPEVYSDAAEYFDPENVEDMTAAINRILTDNKLRQTLIKKGQKQAAKYSWAHTAKQTLELYNQILSKK